MLEYNDLITSIPEDILSSDWHHRIQNVHFKDLDDIFSFYYKYILQHLWSNPCAIILILQLSD